MTKDFTERILELIKTDKELHDACVRLINAAADAKEVNTELKRRRLK